MTPANQDLDAPQALVWADLPSRQFDYVHKAKRGAAVVGPQSLVLPGWSGRTCHIVGDDRLLSSAAMLSWNWDPCPQDLRSIIVTYTLNEHCVPPISILLSSLLASYVTLRDFNIYYHFLNRSSSLRYL
jgi:hypothetical protein